MMNELDNNAVNSMTKSVRRVVKYLVVRRIEYLEHLRNLGV